MRECLRTEENGLMKQDKIRKYLKTSNRFMIDSKKLKLKKKLRLGEPPMLKNELTKTKRRKRLRKQQKQLKRVRKERRAASRRTPAPRLSR